MEKNVRCLRSWMTRLGWVAVVSVGDAATPEQALAIYEPFRVEAAALAPDGRHVAFAVRDGRRIALHIFETADPGRKVKVPFEDQATAHLALLEWATADRLIAMSDAPQVVAISVGGEKVTPLLDARNFVTPEFPLPRAMRTLGIPLGDRGGLMLETTAPAENGDVTLSLVRLDLATGQRQVSHARQMVAPGGSLLLDQEGRPRVLLARNESPQRFFHLAENGGPFDWKPMDKLWPGIAGGFHVSAQNFNGRRAIPLGFDRDPHTLFYAANSGRDTFGIYALDLRAGGKTRVIAEDDRMDLASPDTAALAGLVFDPERRTLAGLRPQGVEGTTRWVDAEIARVQSTAEGQFPGRSISLLGWDADRIRFLVLVGGDDGGRYFIFHRADDRSVEYLRRTKIEAEEANRSESLEVPVPGGRLVGTVVLPRHPPVAKPALVVWFHDGPWQQIAPGFQRDAQALATMGFIVVQFDYRGSTGYGLNHREAIRAAFDRVPVADAVAAIEGVAARHAFDRKRVAVGGEGFGGFLALRALQIHPDIFRAGVAINAPLELAQLREAAREVERRRAEFLQDMARMSGARNATFASEGARVAAPYNNNLMLDRAGRTGGGADFDHEVARAYFGGESALAKFSVEADVARLTQPVLFLHEPANGDISILPVQALARTLARRKQIAEVLPLSPQFAQGQPAAHAAAFRRIGEFLNANLYDFKVEIGDVQEKKDTP